MNGLVTPITAGISAFSATNIDDFAILLLFFSQVSPTFRRWDIVVGQYLGFTAIIIASLPGFFGGLVVPQYWIGLLGLIPIAIGLSRLLNREGDGFENVEIEQSDRFPVSSVISPQIYFVAALTFANGSDNISVYLPFFASSNLASLIVIVSLFFLLVGVWCYAAYRLSSQTDMARIFTRYGNDVVPFVLIGLGAFIGLKTEALTPPKLVASCLCLMVIVRKTVD